MTIWYNCQTTIILTVLALIFSPLAPSTVLCADTPLPSIHKNRAERDVTLAIAAPTVMANLKNSHWLLIDVRHPANFERLRIPRSVNIPLYALKTKHYLKSKTLILVNEGYHFIRLQRECQRLLSAGFDRVLILSGGLNAWHRQNGPLEGDLSTVNGLNRMSARVLFQDSIDAGLRIFDISHPPNPASSRLIPRIETLAFSGEATDFAVRFNARLDAMAIDHQSDGMSSVVLFNTNGQGYEQIEPLIEADGLAAALFFLEGGLQEFERFLDRQTLMQQPVHQRISTCQTCP